MIGEKSSRHNISVQHDVLSSTLISGDGNQIHIYNYQLNDGHPPHLQSSSVDASDNLFGVNPYKGIDAFQEEDEARYYGREAQVSRVWEQFSRLYEQSSEPRFLTLYGPSGCGKSSLVRAGLLPEFARSPLPQKSDMRVVLLTPGAHPLEYLALVLARIVENDLSPVKKSKEYEEVLFQRNEEGVCDGLRRIGSSFPCVDKSPLVIVVDQFEEIYTHCADETLRRCFIDNLIEAATDISGHVSVIITLRSDFLEETQGPSGLNQLVASLGLLIPAMTPSELEHAIAQPAADEGYTMDAATVQLLVRDTVGKEGALPLLQFALQQIWEGLSKGIEPGTTIKAIDGVEGALARRAQGIYKGLSSDDQRIARYALVNLVRLEEGVKDTRRRRAIKDLVTEGATEQKVKQVLRRFAEPRTRMVTLASSKETGGIAEITHETLIDNWDQLREWLDEDRKDLRLKLRFEDTANFWDSNGRPEGSLWRSPDLDLLQEYVKRTRTILGAQQSSFLRASELLQVRQKKRQKMRTRGLILGLCLMTISALFAVERWRASEIRQVEQLAATAKGLLEVDPTEGLIHAIAAVELSQSLLVRFPNRSSSSSVKSSLLGAVQSNRGSNLMKSSGSGLLSVKLSPDGKIIASGSRSGFLHIWDISGKLIQEPIRVSEGGLPLLEFSSDGRSLFVVDTRNNISVFNLETYALEEEYSFLSLDEEDSLQDFSMVAVSASNKLVAKGEPDGLVHIFNIDGQLINSGLESSGREVSFITFSPDAKTIVVGYTEGTLSFWNLETDEGVVNQTVHEAQGIGAFGAISFSPDGHYVASSGYDGVVNLWNHEGEFTGVSLKGHTDWVAAAEFSPDGKLIATGDGTGTIYLWDLKGNRIGRPLRGHDDEVRALSFSNDSKYLISSSSDGTVRLWNMDLSPLGQMSQAHSNVGMSVAFSPDGALLASNSNDAQGQIWNLASGEKVAADTFGNGSFLIFGPDSEDKYILSSLGGQIFGFDYKGEAIFGPFGEGSFSAAISPNEQYVAYGNGSGEINIYDLSNQSVFSTITNAHETAVFSLAFSPVKQLLASSGGDGVIRLWKLGGEPFGDPLDAHDGSVTSIAFSPNGQLIASSGFDGTIRLWNLEGDEIVEPFRGHNSWICSVSFSPDGMHILSGGTDETVRIWDLEGNQIGQFLRGKYTTWQCPAVFSPDGTRIASNSEDGKVYWWWSDWEKWLDVGCTQLRNHSAIVNPTTDIERKAKRACDDSNNKKI